MSAQLIPAGESGEFTITAKQLMEASHLTLVSFQEAVKAEALRRRLALSFSENLRDGSITVKWRPER